jgi:hypothetical protein
LNCICNLDCWRHEWPKTDFTKHSIPLTDILSGGPPKDGIPPIDDPTFKPVSEIDDLGETEPVIGVPIAETFCPLCNAAMVFDRRVGNKILDFGTTGKLRNSDLIMWDRQTESWWQQFLGEAIVGSMTGTKLKALPVCLESWRNFKKRFPKGQVLTPTGAFASLETYCCNPYGGYDTQAGPYPHFLTIEMPKGIPAMVRVVSLEDKSQAW